MRKALTLFLFILAGSCFAQYAPVTQSYYNSSTHQAAFNHIPSTFLTYTPTVTNTPTATPTNTFTPTPTWTSTTFKQSGGSAVTVNGGLVSGYAPTFTPTPTFTVGSYIPNAVATFVDGLFHGAGATFTPTPTFTPVPGASANAVPNVVLSGKMLGSVSEATTISSNVCTVTHTSHGYSTGDIVILTGSPTGGGSFSSVLRTITGTATNTYTFTTSGLADGPVTSAAETFWFKGTRCLNSNLISAIGHSGTGVAAVTFTNTQADSSYIYQAQYGNDINTLSLSETAITTNALTLTVKDTAPTSQNATAIFSLLFYNLQ